MWWLLLWACQEDTDGDDGTDGGASESDTAASTSPPTTGDTGGTVVVGELAFTAAPAFEQNTGSARLVGFVALSTDRQSTVRVQVDDGGRTWEHVVDAAATDHRVRVLGLAPDTEHALVVTATAADGAVATASLTATTAALPSDFPAYQVTSDPARMEPGVTYAMFQPYVAMVDPQGVIRWFMHSGGAYGFTLTSSGTMLAINDRTTMSEYDIEGNLIATWRADRTASEPKSAIGVDAEAFHHDLAELSNGNLLALSIERRLIPDFPTSDTDPLAPTEDTWVAGDVVVELQRDGTVVNEWRLLDLIDPQRIGYDVLQSTYWNGFYPPGTRDWSHANAVAYDEVRDEVTVSLRHQDAVVAIARGTGELAWIFAPDSNWRAPWAAKVLAPVVPQALHAYHQHGAKITPSGTLMLFDNGNNRASAFELPKVPDTSNASRGAEFVLDHVTGTWQLAFQFGDDLDPTLFAGAHGDCDPLPQTGNMLVTYGSVRDVSQPSVQVFEVTRTDPPEVVFHLTLDHPLITGRSERLTGLLPGF